ncbi:MAG: T9SS type A sorting domain-containing protein, partial [Bacteroidota bacterium]
ANLSTPWASGAMFMAKYGQSLTGISEFYQQTFITVSPNPTSAKFQVTLSKNIGLPFTLSVHNLLGEIVLQQQFFESSIQLSLNSPAGIYFLRIQNNEASLERKLIIEK